MRPQGMKRRRPPQPGIREDGARRKVLSVLAHLHAGRRTAKATLIALALARPTWR
jgi:hypothetical protein